MKTLQTCLATALAAAALLCSNAASAEELLFEKEWNYTCFITPWCGDAKERVNLRGNTEIRFEYKQFYGDSTGGSLYVDEIRLYEKPGMTGNSGMSPTRD